MTPDQIDLVNQTFRSLDRVGLDPERVYEQLFADHPDMRDRFPDPLGRLPLNFWSGLRGLVARLDDIAGLSAEAAGAAAHHRNMGVNSGEFARLGVALDEVIADVLGAEYPAEHRDAVRGTWVLVTEVLQQRPRSMTGGVL
jgi:hemoglobin-like flavoprotein